MPLKPLPCCVLAVSIGLGLSATVEIGRAQGRTIDIGAGTTERIVAEHDADTWEEFPPFAFGDYEPDAGNTVYMEVIPSGCGALPDGSLCDDNTFVAGLSASFGADPTCPCQGVLVKEVTVQISYDEDRVAELGALESELEMVVYDSPTGKWIRMPGGFDVLESLDVVQGWQAHHAIQIYALRVAPGARDSRTWGAIKALWQ